MKYSFYMILLMGFFLISCAKSFEKTYSDYEPEIMSRPDFEKSIELIAPKPMTNAGKIYIKDKLMFLGDTNTGFHLYDNTDPKKPISIGFLKIPGATDLAIKGGSDVIFVNQAVDLVAFSFDMGSKKITIHKRVKNTFPILLSPDGYYPAEEYIKENVVIDWHKK